MVSEFSRNGVLVSTHPRSGTHLTIDLLRRHFPILHSRKWPMEPLDALYVPIDIAIDSPKVNTNRARRLVHRHRYPILKSHFLQPDYSNLADDAADLRLWMVDHVKTIYVVRNPESTIVSFFAFVKSFQPELTPTREWLESAVRGWISHVHLWSNRDDTLILRFEDLVRDTQAALVTASDFLQLELRLVEPLLPPRLASKWRGRWVRLVGIDSPTTEILAESLPSDVRRSLFTPEHRQFLWDKVNSVASELGYSIHSD